MLDIGRAVNGDAVDRDEAVAEADAAIVKEPAPGPAAGGSAVKDEGLLEEGAKEGGLEPGGGEEEGGDEGKEGDALVEAGEELEEAAQEGRGAPGAQGAGESGTGGGIGPDHSGEFTVTDSGACETASLAGE